ncbi:MAG: DHH family phosphoesterase [Actinomycetota bacterium]|nr:DHH family phosphoesterase [Actinomycetota bacterium]
MSTPYHRAAVHLRHAASVAVCAHVRPDGDAMGSVLAFTLALRAAGVPAVPVLADDGPPPRTYAFLPGYALLTLASELEQPEVFVALDTPSFARLGVAEDMARQAETLIVFDHHPDNQEFGDVNVVDPGAAATAQMVWRFLEVMDVRPTPEIALCCYVALMTDTGRFQYDNTTPAAFRDAATMIEAGADPAQASRLVYQERSAGSLALEARLLSRLTVTNGGRVAWAWLDDDDFALTGASAEESENLPDAVRVIGGIDVAVLLRVTQGEVRGNLRAKTGADVATVAREFGGGGHRAAAGFSFAGTLDELVPRLLAMLPGGAV